MSTPILMLVQGLDGGSAIALALLVTAMFARSVGATEPKEGRSVVIALALAIAAWFGVSSAMASAGDFGSGALALPLLGFALLVPLAIGVAVSLGVGYFRRLLSQPAVQPAVIAVHSLRVIFGAVFLLMVMVGVLPAVFAIPAGAGDVLVGLGAFPASGWLRSGRWGRVLAWNMLGVLDFVLAIALGVFTTTGPLHLIAVSPSSAWLLSPPLVVVPTFVVPFYLLLHFVSLRYLAVMRNQAQFAPAARMEVSA